MIHNVWILNKNGICLIDRSYSNIEIDKTLFGGFITAIETFSEKLVDRQVDSMIMGDLKILYIIGRIVVAIAVDIGDDEREIRRKVTLLQAAFIDQYKKDLDSTKVDIFQDFKRVIDKILYLDWNFEYDVKIRKRLK